MRALLLALLILLLPPSGRAQAQPLPVIAEGDPDRQLRGARFNASTWSLTWLLDGQVAVMAFRLHPSPASELLTEVHRGHSTFWTHSHGFNARSYSKTPSGPQIVDWRAELVDESACGLARLRLDKMRAEWDLEAGSRGVASRPRCGDEMVETVEWHENETTITCVDGPFVDPPYHAQLVLVLDHRARPLLATSELPDAFLGLPVPDYVPKGLPWNLPRRCHPLFEKNFTVLTAPPRESAALSYAWGDDHDDLVWIETWSDFQKTGPFFAFYPDGQAMTFGLQVEGLPHGVWWYLAPDGTLAEARLYALGVELERLPVETVIEPYYVVRTPGKDPRPPLTP